MNVSTIASQVLLPGHIKLQVTNCSPFFLSKKGHVQESPQNESKHPPQKKIMRKKISRKKLSRKETGIA
jgi:hypothetical protein